MATNPRKGRTQTAEQPEQTDNVPQEDTVSDTATTDAEAPAEATESTETELSAEAPTETPAAPAKEKKEPVDHEPLLYDAIVAFGNDRDVNKLQGVYRDIPVAARGKVQGVAMKRAMQEGGLDMAVLGEVLDAFNNLPTTTKAASRTKPAVEDADLVAVKLSALLVAYAALRGEHGDEPHEKASAWYSKTEALPEGYEAVITKMAENVIVSTGKGGRGGSGTRASFKETLKDLIDSGRLPAGAVLKGANDAEATVNADGTVVTKGETFKNLSAAAKAHRPGKDGKGETSTNGWDFWTYEGRAVGGLRKE